MDDYRESHLERGATYDATIATAPFDAYMANAERALLRELVPSLFPGGKPRALDFACGTGRITETIAPLCAETTGVDISPSMLQEAQRKCPSVKFVHADLTSQQVELGPFDLITSFRFFGNAQDELRAAVLRALNRLLRADGVLLINSHRNPYSFAALLGRTSSSELDLHYFKLKRLLAEHGFAIERSRPIGFWMYRYKLMLASYEDARSQRMEQRFKHPWLTPFAPDALVVARKVGAPR